MSAIARHQITGVILAGGRGQRMGGVDKGLVDLAGRPLAAWAVERLAPQVGTLMINANREPQRWQALGYPLIADAIAGFAGPLAGLHAALGAAKGAYVVCVPCDCPRFPGDLVARLCAPVAAGAALAVAETSEGWQPVFVLARTSLLAPLEAYLNSGRRKAEDWLVAMGAVAVHFDEAQRFANLNTPEDLRRLTSAEF